MLRFWIFEIKNLLWKFQFSLQNLFLNSYSFNTNIFLPKYQNFCYKNFVKLLLTMWMLIFNFESTFFVLLMAPSVFTIQLLLTNWHLSKWGKLRICYFASFLALHTVWRMIEFFLKALFFSRLKCFHHIIITFYEILLKMFSK